MTIIDIRYQLNKILSYDRIYPNNCEKYENLLKVLADAGDSRYLLYKAKFLQRTKEFDKAEECYKEMISSANDLFSAYYGLYSLAVGAKNYEDAYKYILLCDEFSDNTTMDLSLHIALAKACYNLAVNPDEFYNEEIKAPFNNKKQSNNYSVDRLYDEFRENFNKHDFINAIVSLKKIRAIDDSVNSHFESKILFSSINNLLDLERKKYIEFVKENGITAEFNDGKVDVRQLLNYMQMSVITDLDLVEEVFYDNYDYISQNTNSVAVGYLEKRIIERRKFESLTDEEIDDYRKCIIEVRRAMKNEDFQRAIDFSELGKELTGAAVFDYYTGQAYYRLGDDLQAIKKLNEYLENGGIKSLRAKGYLALAYTNIGNYQDASLLQEEVAQLKSFYVRIGKSKIYTGPTFKAGDKKDNEETMTVDGISNNVDKFMDEELSIGEFYSYSFSQKMALIRKLYFTNMTKVADKLMKEVEKESKSSVEKQYVSKERQNKKLYIAKGKLGGY